MISEPDLDALTVALNKRAEIQRHVRSALIVIAAARNAGFLQPASNSEVRIPIGDHLASLMTQAVRRELQHINNDINSIMNKNRKRAKEVLGDE